MLADLAARSPRGQARRRVSCRSQAARRRSCWCAWRSTPAARAHRAAPRRPLGRRRDQHPPQHAAVEGRQAAPGARGSPDRSRAGDGGYTLGVDPSEVDALAVLRDADCGIPAARRGRRPRRRRPGCAALWRCSEASLPSRERRLGRTATGAARGGAGALLETQLRARLRLGDVGDVIGELEAPSRPTRSRRVLGAADHRAVPSRAPGRRAGDLPTRPQPARRRARPRPRPAAPAARAADPRPRRALDGPARTTDALDADRGQPAVDARPSSSAARRSWPSSPRCSRAIGSSRSSGRAASARRRSAIAAGRQIDAPMLGHRRGVAGHGSRPPRRPTRSSTR